ncbi:MAG TPA: hypothetical protein VNH11_24045 [Pirellulales bacterium]|nr:hypothetical protein [Pirellulales bacterium]
MDFRFERIQRHLEDCLLQAGVFQRTVEGAQLFDVEIINRAGAKWLVIAAGIAEAESRDLIQRHRRDRATIPIQISPRGQASILLVTRPYATAAPAGGGRFVTDFSTDVGTIELYQRCYIRIDDLESPAIRQIRWELDPVEGYKPPIEPWLQQWEKIVGCYPAHAPSHWHINSPPMEEPGRRGQRRVIIPPELRIATGLPNPLLLLLSIANWLRSVA